MVSHLYSAPVTTPLGASEACEALWPQLFTPRPSAVWITTFGLSTWQVMRSQPASTSAFAASASRTGSDHSPVKITWTVPAGLTLPAPGGEEGVDVRQPHPDWFGRDEAELSGLRGRPRRHAVDEMRLVEEREIGA